LFARLRDGLAGIERVVLHGSPHAGPRRLCSPRRHGSRRRLPGSRERGVNAPASHFYAIEAVRWMGLGDAGAVRAGISLYTDGAEVDRLLTAVEEVAR